MKKSIMMVATLLFTSSLTLADDAAWGDVGGGSFGEPVQDEVTSSPAPAAPEDAACGQDDPRMQNLIAILKDIKAGNQPEPVQMSFSTYMGLSEKVRKLLGDNIVISTTDCKKQFIFDGELTGKVTMPFPEAMSYINDALRARDADKLKFVFANIKAAPDTLHNILSYSVVRSFPLATGKVLVQAANIQPVRNNKEATGILLLSLYQALGGRLAQGEKNKVYLYSYSGDRTVEIVYSGDKYQVTVGGRQVYINKASITDMKPSQLMEAYAAMGIAGERTYNMPKQEE